MPVQALLSAALGPSTITVDVSGTVMRCHRRMARVAGAWHGCDPPHGATAIGTDGEVGCGGRAIAFWCDCRQARSGTSVTGIEQPMTESEAVAAGAIGEEAVVADAVEAVR